ncbi:Holliday junction resolvase RuvX [secondary endosymbiont of Ctenarytaina eucalypti]|uniref:Putative pre-16S rRNA nuclease n=1 Tax=secondary endosymbiont of Ctenarytaina eucalypti TaxID=1199245 RepID=J3TG15_9ENTR|nr:Holliday junction resolvase RuvX [secondary endosymbiont of Ctenarytaina eucalypti]AFP85287.1 putative endonuclease involved in recombination [secondary endosymbiont of Ctenarytaina eucalypti]
MTTAGIIMSFDFGTQRIGLAIGQYVTCSARPLEVLNARDGMPHWPKIETLLNEWRPDRVVVGLPLSIDGSEQPITSRARTFANRLQSRFKVHVVLHDERLSTVEARSVLFARGGYRALEKSKVDAWAAVIILESWLEQFPQ